MKLLAKKIPLLVFAFLFFFSVSSFNNEAKAETRQECLDGCIQPALEWLYVCLEDPSVWFPSHDVGVCYSTFIMYMVPECYEYCGY